MNKIESKHFPFIYGGNYMQKYNRETKQYEKYNVPREWNCPLCGEDMDEVVNSAQCGKELPLGDTYTSLEIHNQVGLGYGVCGGCYQEEYFRKYGRTTILC